MSEAAAYAGPPRLHVALAVRDVNAAINFYRVLFDCEPSKVRSDYAKFEPIEPAVNLTLNLSKQPVVAPMPSHYGIQLSDGELLAQTVERLQSAKLIDSQEDQSTCCYAVMDKVWAIDPDGHHWEVFMVTQGNADNHGRLMGGEVCCAPESQAAATAQSASCDPASGCC